MGVLLLAGCGDGGVSRPASRSAYPDLNESPPPQPLPAPPSQDPGERLFVEAGPPAEVDDDGWIYRQEQMHATLCSLEEYAAKAAPNDPFALKPKEIDALSKRAELIIY